MSEILQMFTGNPLATLVGRKIEAATSSLLEAENWALNMEICDIINENDDESKNAVRAIKKRLQIIEQDRDFTVKSYTYLLTVLETCVSNCSHRFHAQVMTKDFIQDLVKFIGPKNNPPIELQERVLRLIERWAENFKNYPDLAGVVQVYNDLKAKGVIFPAHDISSDVPIETPQPRHIPRPPPNTRSSSMSRQQSQVSALSPVELEGEVYSKVCRDLEVVQTTLNVFNSIMNQIEKTNNQEDWSLCAELETTCHQMKERIEQLIEKVSNEDLTIELLRLNDQLLGVFKRYGDQLKSKDTLHPTSQASASTSATPQLSGLEDLQIHTSSSTQQQQKHQQQQQQQKHQLKPADETSLIDFKDEPSDNIQSSLNNTSLSSTTDKIPKHQLHSSPNPFDTSPVTDAFLMVDKSFATTSGQTSLVNKLDKLRLTNDQKEFDKANPGAFSGKSAGDVPAGSVSSVREQDFVEMENWLLGDGGMKQSDLPQLSLNEPATIPNPEFENFIASRALAGAQSQETRNQSVTNPSNNASANTQKN